MASKKKTKFTIGLDLGGTKLAAGLVGPQGEILDSIKIPVEMNREGSATQTQKRVLAMMADLILDFRKRYPKECSSKYFQGVGLASAGPLNTESGKLIYPSNFPGWRIYPVREKLSSELHRRKFSTYVHFQNDAIAAALAESWIGEARGLKTFVVVTIGTGIGSGVIVHGRPCHTKGMGSEFGHIIVDLPGLKTGQGKPDFYSVEGIASGTGLLRRAQSMGFSGDSVESLVLAIEAGESKYQVLFNDMSMALAVLCYNLSLGFRMEKIIFSGGLLKIKKFFLPALKKQYASLISEFNHEFRAPMAIARGGTQAGVIGAAYLPYL